MEHKEDLQRTAIHKYLNVYKLLYPEKITKYWMRRLYGAIPSIIFFSKNNQIKEIDFSKYISNKNLLEMFYRFESKMIKDGNAVYTIDYLLNNDKEISFFINITDLVIYSEYKTREEFVQTIGNYQKGTIPLIEMRTYTRYQDIREYKLDDTYDYQPEQLNEISNYLNKKEVITHNLGIVRAGVMTNNINYDNWEGRPEITKPINEKIEQLDVIYSRIMTKIELETTHLAVSKESGAIVGDSSKWKEALQNERDRLKDNYQGDLKITEYNFENIDDVDASIIEGSPELTSLQNQVNLEEYNIDKILGISDDYNGQGKTNDVEAKVDKVGDSSTMESIRRKNYRQSQFKELLQKIVKIAKSLNIEEFAGIEDVEISFFVSDYRQKMAMIKAFPNILGQIPIIEAIKQIFQVDDKTANDWLSKKDQEVHNNLVSFLASNNNNLPAGMENLKDLKFVDYERIEEKENKELEAKKAGSNNENKQSAK